MKDWTSKVATKLRDCLGPKWPLWTGLALVGAVANFGTAAQRLSQIFPSYQPMDFAAYYVGAWALRLGIPPYQWPGDLLPLMRSAHGVLVPTWEPGSPPPWEWMMQAFTPLRFPLAAWLWLGIQIGLLAWSTVALRRLAGLSGRTATLALGLLVVTFGPVFLCLTIGQNAILLLVGALLVGRYLAGASRRAWPSVAGWMLAVMAKLFPALWLAAVPLVRRRLALAMLATAVAVFGTSWLAQQPANRDYWFRLLPGGQERFVDRVSVDDQSVEARVILLGRTATLGFSGREPATRHEVAWQPPWQLSGRVIRLISILIVAGLAAGVVLVGLRGAPGRQPEAFFYLVALFSLLVMPHIERYNHTVLLAPIALLWGWGPRYRWAAALAYCLVGLSRLNHLWAMVLPWPLGAIATGTCLYAVLLLGVVLALRIRICSSGESPATGAA